MKAPSMIEEVLVTETFKKNRHARQICWIYKPTTRIAIHWHMRYIHVEKIAHKDLILP